MANVIICVINRWVPCPVYLWDDFIMFGLLYIIIEHINYNNVQYEQY